MDRCANSPHPCTWIPSAVNSAPLNPAESQIDGSEQVPFITQINFWGKGCEGSGSISERGALSYLSGGVGVEAGAGPREVEGALYLMEDRWG